MASTIEKIFEEEKNAVLGNETCKIKPGFAEGLLIALAIITIMTILFLVRMSRVDWQSLTERFVDPADMQNGVYFARAQRAACPPHIGIGGDARRLACCI